MIGKMNINGVIFNKCFLEYKAVVTGFMQSNFSSITVFLTRFEGLKLTVIIKAL